MSETKTSFERLRAIWQAWSMSPGPAAKEQREVLAAVEAYLKTGPAAILRGMQALLVDPEQPGASKRALFGPLWQATQEHWAAAGTGGDDVMLMQAVLLASDWPQSKIVPALLSPWMAMRGRERQRKELEAWCEERAVEMHVAAPPTTIAFEAIWPLGGVAVAAATRLNQMQLNDYELPISNRGSAVRIEGFEALRTATTESLLQVHHEITERISRLEVNFNKEYEGATQEYLWWGQARYCHTLRKPFRRIGDHRKIYLAAREAAERAKSLPVEPSAAYLQEVLHALDLPILEVRPLAEHVKQLRNVLASDPPPTVPAEIALLLRQDAFGLPVSLLCTAPNTPDDALFEQLGVAADTPIDLGDWAAWIFRELVLLLRWPEPN